MLKKKFDFPRYVVVKNNHHRNYRGPTQLGFALFPSSRFCLLQRRKADASSGFLIPTINRISKNVHF